MPKIIDPKELKGFIIWITVFNLSLLGYIWHGHTTWLDKKLTRHGSQLESFSKTQSKHETRISVLEVKIK